MKFPKTVSNKINYIILFLILIIVSCKNKSNTLYVEHHNFVDEVTMQQNLIFTFDKDICPDSLLGKVDSTQYFNITPSVRGIYRWTSNKELMFVPLNGFKACSSYILKLTSKITEICKIKKYEINDETFSFHTPYLKLESIQSFWQESIEQNNKVNLKIDLNFNLPVNVSDIEKYLKTIIDNKEVSFKVITQENSNDIEIEVPNLETTSKNNISIKIIVQKGLPCINTSYKTTEENSLSNQIAPPNKLEIINIKSIYENNESMIEVKTNQPISSEEIIKSVSIENYSTKILYQVELLPNGFRLKSMFNDWSIYQLKIDKSIIGRLGGKMAETYTEDIGFNRQESNISFANKKGIYLNSKGLKNIAVNITNIKKVNVSIYKIFENNINSFISRHRGTSRNEDGRLSGYSYDYYDMEQYGNMIEEKDIETKDLAQIGHSKLLHISSNKLEQYKGVYLVVVKSSDENTYIADAKLISISDVGIMAKKTNDEIWVFTNSLSETKPIKNALIKLISFNNQVISETQTNDDGVGVFRNLKSNTFIPAMVCTYIKNDFNFMLLNDAEVLQSRFDVDGYKINTSGLQTFIYGDRDIYRPGEIIHSRFILRNNLWETIKDYPIKIKLLLPNGQEYKSVIQKLNNMGSTGLDIPLPASALTGNYTLEVLTANDILLETKTISVEEFMPDKIEISTKINKSEFTLNDSITGILYAKNLYGTPATQRNYEYEVSLSYKRFSPEKYKDYQFDIVNNKYLNIDRNLSQGVTDNNGMAKIKYEFPKSISNSGLMNGTLYTTVFDETGRPVHKGNVFNVYTQNIFIGAKQQEYWYGVGDKIKIPLIAVTKDGITTTTKARIKLVQVEWFSWMTTGDNGYSIKSNGKEKVLIDNYITIPSGGGEYITTPSNSGDYELRISLPGSDTYTAIRYSAWGMGYTNSNSFETNNEGIVTIETDKKTYNTGEEAKILFKTPFSGTLLVTVEREKINEYHYIKTDKKSASISIKMKDEYCPNVYISATLFHQSIDDKMPLTVAHGYHSIKVEKNNLKLPIQIIAADLSRSKKQQTIKVKTTPGIDAEVTIAVIDEGILNIKGYETPDIYNFFYQKRALNVSSYDIYPFLMPELGGKKSKTGGDGYAQKIAEMEGRANPLANNRINLVALWSGPLKLNSKGEAIYTFNIPQFSGSLRIMTVVHRGKSFGSAEKKMTVSDPIILSPSIPRFLSPGDTAYIPMMVSNTTKNPIQGKSNIQVSGNLTVSGISSQNIYIPANSEKTVMYKLYSQGMGQGQINMTYNTSSEVFTHNTNITIRPSAGLQKISDGGIIEANKTKELNFSSQFIPQYSQAKIVISQSPMAQFAKSLDYLVHYPYGCIEQTTSAAFPQLYISELLPYTEKNNSSLKFQSKYFIQEAIKKINGMQLYNGAFSYWPGESYESHWGTAYATHFLLESKKAGYEVNNQIINRSLEYLLSKLRYKESEFHRSRKDNKWIEQQILKQEYCYDVYVLAIAGKADISSMNYLKNNIDKLTSEGKYLLGAAFASIGDNSSYKSIIQTKNTTTYESEFGGSFHSYLRESAIMLNVMAEKEPNNPKTAQMVRDISIEMANATFINTQEASWCLMALGKYMKTIKNENKNSHASIFCNGINIANFNGKDIIIDKNIIGKKVTIKTNGNAPIYYFSVIEGITIDGSFKEEDNKIKVRRTYFDRYGKLVNLNNLKQNDLLVVKLSASTLENRYIENIVITDMLPAGFEIENPRINAIPETNWIKDASTSDYFDMRDDRINYFTSLDNKTRNFYYLVRCVSPGEFKLGPVSADAMYRGEYHSMNGKGKTIIKQ